MDLIIWCSNLHYKMEAKLKTIWHRSPDLSVFRGVDTGILLVLEVFDILSPDHDTSNPLSLQT